MRAMIITKPGGPEVLAMGEVETPVAGPGHIRVKVEASALNRADLLQRQGLYAAPAWAHPDIPGLEYVGVVESLGEGVREWSVGDRVMGIIAGASCAEFVVVHAREAMAVPEGMDVVQAAAIPEAFLTAYDALWLQAGVRMGDPVLIHAVGSGVGTAALQMAKLCGAHTLGTSRTPEKLERCVEMGLDTPILAKQGRFLEDLKEAAPGGVQVIADFIGGAYLSQNLEALRSQGVMIVIGLMGGREATFPMGTLLRRRLRVMGTVLRARPLEEKIVLAQDFARQVLPHFSAGRLKPVVDRVFAMEDLAKAHETLASNQTFGKVIVTW